MIDGEKLIDELSTLVATNYPADPVAAAMLIQCLVYTARLVFNGIEWHNPSEAPERWAEMVRTACIAGDDFTANGPKPQQPKE